MDISLNQQTYEQFKKDIMTFALKPGEPVSAQKVAQRYNVSRTPAREALVRLQNEGMVDIYPQSKSVISKIKTVRIHQEWFVRRSLELEMVDKLFNRVSEDDIVEMRETVKRMERLGRAPRIHENSYDYIKSDDRFHEITYRVSGESLAAQIIENMLPNYRRMRILVDFDEANKERTVGEHKHLITLIERRDRDAYRDYLTMHMGHIISDIEDIRRDFPDMFDHEDST